MDDIRIVYFLEDRAQEMFIKALVDRIARDEGIESDRLRHDIRSARHGSKVLSQLKDFIMTIHPEGFQGDLLVIAVDGNCKGHNGKVRELSRLIESSDPFGGSIIYAVPDPHIERWYLMDQGALKDALGLDRPPNLPSYKCKKDYYKQILAQALADSNTTSLLGGPEYAEDIVKYLNLNILQADEGFIRFRKDLRNALRNIVGAQPEDDV